MANWESAMAAPADAGSLSMPTFATVWRGFDPDQVLEYVRRLTDQLDALEADVRRLQGELSQRDADEEEQAPTAHDQYEGVGARVADLMRTFDQDVERLRQDAEDEAGRIVAEAKSEADRIQKEAERSRGEAAAKAEQVEAEARTEADKILSSLASRREGLLDELRVIRDRVVHATRGIEATIEAATSTEAQIVVVEDAEAGTAN
jgi:cell division septum initiation protein DivIVA